MNARFLGFALAVGQLLLLGCEAKAQHEGGVAPERLSIAHESCARTADCAGELRCVESRCSDTSRSDLGDYHLAAAKMHLANRASQRAIDELRAAVAEYKRLGRVPVDVDCALGSALSALRSDPLKAEESAAKLHRCVTGLVDGSAMRQQALASLARLAEVGFEPSHLAAPEVADRYLTGAPEKPKLDALKVSAVADRKSKLKTFTQWMEVLASPEVKAGLGPCWQQYWEATKNDSLTVKLPYRYSFRLDPDDEAGDRGFLKTSKLPSLANSDLAAATECARAALAPLADNVGRRGGEYAWSSKITVSISP